MTTLITGEERRTRILEFIVGFWALKGFAPTVREVAAGVGLASPSSAFHHLVVLERAGLLLWEPSISRSLRVVQE